MEEKIKSLLKCLDEIAKENPKLLSRHLINNLETELLDKNHTDLHNFILVLCLTVEEIQRKVMAHNLIQDNIEESPDLNLFMSKSFGEC